MIELINVGQDFPDPVTGKMRPVVSGINLTIKNGITALMGPSGCGKSTLLRMMGGVRSPGGFPSGTVKMFGAVWLDHHPDAVMVFQDYGCRPDLTVLENVMLPHRLKLWGDRIPEADFRDRAKLFLQRVGLQDRMDYWPSQLSGGQRQRVALAQAMVVRPSVLLMDEPFGALDPKTRVEMQTMLVELLAASGDMIAVLVTHDVSEALNVAERVVVLGGKPAGIVLDEVVPQGPGADKKTLREDVEYCLKS